MQDFSSGAVSEPHIFETYHGRLFGRGGRGDARLDAQAGDDGLARPRRLTLLLPVLREIHDSARLRRRFRRRGTDRLPIEGQCALFRRDGNRLSILNFTTQD